MGLAQKLNCSTFATLLGDGQSQQIISYLSILWTSCKVNYLISQPFYNAMLLLSFLYEIWRARAANTCVGEQKTVIIREILKDNCFKLSIVDAPALSRSASDPSACKFCPLSKNNQAAFDKFICGRRYSVWK